MADEAFLGVLAGLGGQGAVLRKGKVTAVATGALTVQVDGDTLPNIPYLKGTWAPAVNDVCFMLTQAGFGTLAIGSPVAQPAQPAPAAQTTLTAAPSLVDNWEITTAYPAGHWRSDGTLGLTQSQDFMSTGAWFYAAGAWTSFSSKKLSSATMQLQVDSGTVQLALHKNVDRSTPLNTYGDPLTFSVPLGTPTTVNLPLQWAKDLVSGTAKGIVARSSIFDAHLTGNGTITLTSL
jgi:hypothetical protein